MTEKLTSLRHQITVIDEQLLQLLHQRREIVQHIGIEKTRQGLALRDEKREQDLLKHLQHYAKQQQLSLSPQDIADIFKVIMRQALVWQEERSPCFRSSTKKRRS